MQMKWTTNTQEGDATILGIWNLQLNHFRYLESVSIIRQHKEKGKRQEHQRKERQSTVYDILKTFREFP